MKNKYPFSTAPSWYTNKQRSKYEKECNMPFLLDDGCREIEFPDLNIFDQEKEIINNIINTISVAVKTELFYKIRNLDNIFKKVPVVGHFIYTNHFVISTPKETTDYKEHRITKQTTDDISYEEAISKYKVVIFNCTKEELKHLKEYLEKE